MPQQLSQTVEAPIDAQHRRIRDLCDLLASSALQLDELRKCTLREVSPVRSSQSTLEPFWGNTAEDDGNDTPRKTPYWYGAVEPVFEELERLIRVAPQALRDALLSDSDIHAKAPLLHQVRAAYEYDKEVVLAEALVGSPAGNAELASLIAQEAFWAFSPELRQALHGCRRIAVAGSGPLPLTALGIVKELDVSVTAVECDETAFDLGRQIVALAGCAAQVHCVQARIEEFARLDRFDAIVAAVLVGVDMGRERRHRRDTLAKQLVAALAPGSRLIVREPHGLGQLFHPPLDLKPSDRFEVELLLPKRSPFVPYRSGIAVLHRTGAATA